MTQPGETPFDTALDRDLLVEASAGTGKTYALTTLAARLIVEDERRIEELLIVTFTVAATGELRSRIRRLLAETLREARADGQSEQRGGSQATKLVEHWRKKNISPQTMAKRLERALRDFDRASITTIHGFCQRALREFAAQANVPFEFSVAGDDAQDVGDAVRDFWRLRMASEPIPLLSFANEKKFRPVRGFWGEEDAVGWTMEHHAIPREIRGAPAADGADTDGGAEAGAPRDGTNGSRADTPPASAAFFEAFRAAHAVWQDQNIRSAFQRVKADGWKKGQRDDRAIDAVETALNRNDPDLLPPQRAAVFARDNLVRRRYKSSPPPESPLWDCLEKIGKAGESWLAAQRRDLLEHAKTSLHHASWSDRDLSFNALLVELHRTLEAPGGERLAARIRQRFPVALIDEFQDTDRLQASIFRKAYSAPDDPESRGRLFIVGDPKQSIYRFRGADVFAYLEAKEQAKSATRLELADNYRSTGELLDAVNAIFDREHPFLLRQIEFTQVQAAPDHEPGALRLNDSRVHPAPFQFRLFGQAPNGKPWTKGRLAVEAARQAASEIAGLLASAAKGDATVTRNGQSQPLEAGDIAVLTRTGKQGLQIAEALRRFGIESVELGVDSVFESSEAQSLHRLLDALCADESEFDAADRLRGALADELFGLDMRRLFGLRDDDQLWEKWSARARNWRDSWGKDGIATFMRRLLFTSADDEPTGATNLLGYPNGRRRLTNFLHLTDLLHDAETRNRLSPLGLLDWFARAMTDLATGETAQLRLESDENLVKVVTVHRAKGLEFPIVYCPFAWHGQQPKRTSTAAHYDPQSKKPVLDLLPEEEARDLQRAEDYADELRLLYVALTRARYRCVVTWGDANDCERSALAWLLCERRSADAGNDAGTDAGGASWKAVEANAKKAKEQGVEGWTEALGRLAAKAPGAIHVERVSGAPPFPQERAASDGASEREAPERERPATGEARALMRELKSIRQRTSYSALATEDGAARSHWEHVQAAAPDHDDAESPPDDAEDAEEAENAEEAQASTDANVFTMPRGGRIGRFLHAIFERCLEPGADHAAVCREILGRYRLDRKWLEVTTRMVARTLEARLAPPDGGPPFAIGELDRPIAEMEFHLPVRGMGRTQLRQCLLDHGYEAALPPSDAKIEGFLHGYIDLVACHQGRWYVIDYKSNWLGLHSASYRGTALEQAMRNHGYHLQYLLYLAALDRHLRLRLVDYDYDAHIGGAFYLFVRGIGHGLPENGIFADRPSKACIDAINACLGLGRKPA